MVTRTQKRIIEQRDGDDEVTCCDICGAEGQATNEPFINSHHKYIHHCCICGRDVCHNCRVLRGDELYNDSWHYWEAVYCVECYKKGKSFMTHLDQMKDMFDEYVEVVWSKWSKNCMEE